MQHDPIHELRVRYTTLESIHTDPESRAAFPGPSPVALDGRKLSMLEYKELYIAQ
jgi:hypothetical protein